MPTDEAEVRIDRLEKWLDRLDKESRECERWRAEHVGMIREKWRNQEATNQMVVKSITDLATKLDAITKRVWMGIGAASILAGLASFMGSLMSQT